MTKTEALRMALEALEKMDNCCPATDPSGQDAHDTAYQTMHILRTVINEAPPEPEPLAWVTQAGSLATAEATDLKTGLLYGWTPLYTAPANATEGVSEYKKWVAVKPLKRSGFEYMEGFVAGFKSGSRI